MAVCLSVCMYICIYVCVYVSVYVSIYASVVLGIVYTNPPWNVLQSLVEDHHYVGPTSQLLSSKHLLHTIKKGTAGPGAAYLAPQYPAGKMRGC